MCYSENLAQHSTAKNASEDVYDLLIFEHERVEIENAMQLANATFNNALTSYIEIIRNFNEANPQSFLENFMEECEIQSILREEH